MAKSSPNNASTVSYIISSDSGAIVEHTNKVLYLEDNDLAYFGADGGLELLRGASRKATDTDASRRHDDGNWMIDDWSVV